MAFRRPLYYDGSDLREMTDTHIGQIRSRCVNLYGANPSVDITVPSSGGDLGTINDTRKTAGTAISRTSSFAAEFETNEPGTVTVGYSRLDENVESVTQPADTNNRKNFLYQSSGNIYAMTNNDMYDTFYDSAINTLVDGNDRDGTYRIHTGTSLSGHTLISNTAVFSDTRANTGAYTAGGIPEAVDQPFTVTNYYLFRTNQGTLTAQSQLAMLLRSDNDIQTISQANSDALLAADMRYWGTQKIRYSVNGSGNNRGSGMANTILNGSGNYQQRFVNADDYRSQEFPNGTAITANTYFLRIRKI